jgi:hypothetical protein
MPPDLTHLPSTVPLVSTEGDETGTTSWQPATSEPGELYTVEGQIRGTGAFARGLKHRDPHGASYRRSMTRVALTVLGIGVAVALAAVLLL